MLVPHLNEVTARLDSRRRLAIIEVPMHFTKFRIQNFKGIQDAEVKLDRVGQGRILTFVGLNESGKTTLLEAINAFAPDDAAESVIQSDVFRRVEATDMVPKHRKDNFTGEVRISASVVLSDEDVEDIEKMLLSDHNLQLDRSQFSSQIEITNRYEFKDSELSRNDTLWSISLHAKTKRAKYFRKQGPSDEPWTATIKHIRGRLPRICYFPTFLFEFPARVYLANPPSTAGPQNAYYCQIIQDVLDSLDDPLKVDKHIVERVQKVEDNGGWDFFKFLKSDRKQQVDAVMAKLESRISETVFTRWNEILASEVPKDIKIEWGIDEGGKNPPIYLSFSVQEGVSKFSIAERSLGFRWFFCFLLFTQFRGSHSGRETLFLLDEPASNLHSTAQAQLLKSFEAVTAKNNWMLYSTHSHYMINPRWLEGAFIVRNRAIDYDDELESKHKFLGKETDIEVTPYRQWVGEHGHQFTYFQPILDALEYAPSALEFKKGGVFVEGKSDFYMFTYFSKVIFKLDSRLHFMPAGGATDIGPLISLYLGWGYPFLALLDDDSAGRAAKARYLKEWHLSDDNVKTLEDVNSDLKGMRLEDLLSDEATSRIARHLGMAKVKKHDIGRFFQEMLARAERFTFDVETVNRMRAFLKQIEAERAFISLAD